MEDMSLFKWLAIPTRQSVRNTTVLTGMPLERDPCVIPWTLTIVVVLQKSPRPHSSLRNYED